MTSIVEFADADILTISNVLSTGECELLIQRAEAIGFGAASVRTANGPKLMPTVRNNDRVSLTDPGLAELMWKRVAHLLPVLDGQHAVGVDPGLRFYRYQPGQKFKRHRDGCVTNGAGYTSKLSYLIYLNNDFEGGATAFYDDAGSVDLVAGHVVTPIIGSALLFRHKRRHEGTVVTSGHKYVLRSDVFYSV